MKFFRSTLVCLYVMLTGCVEAQITGEVMDAVSNQPLKGVQAKVQNSAFKAITDGQHTLRLVRLKSNGLIGGFTAVADDAESIQFSMDPIIKRTAKRGLGYQKGGAFRLDLTLRSGIYALCEWTKGVMDKRYRPGERGWVLEVER